MWTGQLTLKIGGENSSRMGNSPSDAGPDNIQQESEKRSLQRRYRRDWCCIAAKFLQKRSLADSADSVENRGHGSDIMVNRIVVVVYEEAESMRRPCGSRASHVPLATFGGGCTATSQVFNRFNNICFLGTLHNKSSSRSDGTVSGAKQDITSSTPTALAW